MKKLIVFVAMLTALIFYSAGCTYNRAMEEGYNLAKAHCQSCHQFPEAGLLDKKTWANYVLPKMGSLLGFRHFETGSYYEDGKIPEALPLADWNKVVNYYLSQAPDSLETSSKKLQIGLKNYEVVIPSFTVKDPATTCVSILGVHQFLFADGVLEKVFLLSENGLKDSFKVGKGVVNVQMNESYMKSLAMGVLYPSDEKEGSLAVQNIDTKESVTIIDSLQRPVYVEYGQLNKDTLSDIVVCEFGNMSGQLSWFENRGNGKYLKHVLRPLPGAIRTQIVDVDKDGDPDIVALMAQGDEGIFIYYNKGSGQFEEKRVLQFPPSYGSNYFELADFNKDGYPDILATNGDNGDYPPILKPYHGTRIYLNDGQNNFKEKAFLPQNGVGKAMARDFDGDGDLDIASISYFPDYDHSPDESFIYWENRGELSFQSFSFKEASIGRWLTMDVGDLEGDGDLDILLGNAKFPLGKVPRWLMDKWNKYSPSVLVLKNKLKE
jgi:hypothetical protein